MSTLEEWQEKVESDFPKGALFYRSDWIDKSDDTIDFHLTTALTVWAIDASGYPQVIFWDSQDDKDFRFSMMTYQQTQDNPLIVKVTTQDNVVWYFVNSISDKVANEGWLQQRADEQAMALRGGV